MMILEYSYSNKIDLPIDIYYHMLSHFLILVRFWRLKGAIFVDRCNKWDLNKEKGEELYATHVRHGSMVVPY